MSLTSNTLLLATFLVATICIFWFLMSFLYAGIYIFSRPLLAYISPNIRAILIQLCAWGGPIMALGSALLLLSPAVFLLPTFYQHCHTPECVTHVPNLFKSANFTAVISIITISFLGLGLNLLVKQHKKISYKISSLCELISEQRTTLQDNDIQIIDSSFPVVLSAGLIKPYIIISNEIERSLSSSHFQLVLMYELTLCQRYNNISSMLSKLSTLAWPQFAKKWLLHDLLQANQEAARTRVLQMKRPRLPNVNHQNVALPDHIKHLFDSMSEGETNQKSEVSTTAYSIFMKSLGMAIFSLQHLFFIIFTTSTLHLAAENV